MLFVEILVAIFVFLARQPVRRAQLSDGKDDQRVGECETKVVPSDTIGK